MSTRSLRNRLSDSTNLWPGFVDVLATLLIVIIFVLMIFYIILGMFLDGISAVVLTMAIIEPMIRQAGFDMIWFGIFW